MKKLLTILLVLVAIASMGREVSKTGFVQTGAAIIAPAMRFSTSTDYVTANDTFNIDITCKQMYTQIINYSIELDSISGAPSVSIQLQGRVFDTDSWADLGSPITWEDESDNPLAGSYLTANTYRLFRIRLIASAATQRANITAFLFRSTLTAGGTTTQGVNIGTNQAIYGTTAMTIGNGSQTVAVNSSDWDISTTGVMTGIGAITTNGLITGTAGATLTGAAINLNASSNFVTNIGTGTTNAAISIGGGSNTVAVNSSAWDISTDGAVTGLTTLSASGAVTVGSIIVAQDTCKGVQTKAVGNIGVLRVTAASTLKGLSGGVAGQLLRILNTTATTLVLKHNGTGTQKFMISGGSDLTMTGQYNAVTLTFDGTYWYVTGKGQ